jgi:hypothetical protein
MAENMSGKYDDIIHMERPVSRHHVPMPLENRAAQFAPFAALTGYDDAVDEAARITGSRIELSEEMKGELDMKLSEIASHIAEHPEVSVTYFVPDLLKDGGEYVTVTGAVRKINLTERQIVLENIGAISIDDVLELNYGHDYIL